MEKCSLCGGDIGQPDPVMEVRGVVLNLHEAWHLWRFAHEECANDPQRLLEDLQKRYGPKTRARSAGGNGRAMATGAGQNHESTEDRRTVTNVRPTAWLLCTHSR